MKAVQAFSLLVVVLVAGRLPRHGGAARWQGEVRRAGRLALFLHLGAGLALQGRLLDVRGDARPVGATRRLCGQRALWRP
eukprot:1878155-Pyramimonas_sp.AAC.1